MLALCTRYDVAGCFIYTQTVRRASSVARSAVQAAGLNVVRVDDDVPDHSQQRLCVHNAVYSVHRGATCRMHSVHMSLTHLSLLYETVTGNDF